MNKPAVQGTAREPAERQAVAADGVDTRFRLHLDDLIPGIAGEIVLFNDSALREVVLEAPTLPIASGEVEAHTTAEGVDVAGYRFLRFSSDLVVFHDPDTNVAVDAVDA